MVQVGNLKKGVVVRFNDGKDLKESRLVRFEKIDGIVVSGKTIHPLNELGRWVFWSIGRIKIVLEGEYRPLLEK